MQTHHYENRSDGLVFKHTEGNEDTPAIEIRIRKLKLCCSIDIRQEGVWYKPQLNNALLIFAEYHCSEQGEQLPITIDTYYTKRESELDYSKWVTFIRTESADVN